MSRIDSIRRECIEMEKSLFYSNLHLLQSMVSYLRSSSLTDLEIEETRKDLGEMALEAQLRGEEFKDAIRMDYKSFCDEIIEVGEKKPISERGIGLLENITIVSGIMILMDLIFSFASNLRLESFIRFHLTPGIIAAFLINIIIVPFLIRGISRESLVQKKKKFISGVSSREVFLILGLVMSGLIWILFRRPMLITVNIGWVVGIYIIILISGKYINREK